VAPAVNDLRYYSLPNRDDFDPPEAEAVLQELAGVFFQPESSVVPNLRISIQTGRQNKVNEPGLANLDARYQTLVEQLPAVVFLVYLDGSSGEAYVSPHIEQLLGYSQAEWLEDPVRWYERIHPDDKLRWSVEAADMFLTGEPLRSVYRVMARNGRVVSFHCEAKMVRASDGRPWFIHGVAFDVTELKQAEESLEEERNFASALLDTVGALVVVLDRDGRIVRFNRECERTTGYSFSEVKGVTVWDLCMNQEEGNRFRAIVGELQLDQPPGSFETTWTTRQGLSRRIAWKSTVLGGRDGASAHVIITGIDVTEAKRLERAILEISGREQRRIGQDLHDGLGQHLTGIAFMSKVLEQKLGGRGLAESAEAAKIVRLVNEAINKTRELSRGLAPVLSGSDGLMTALQELAYEVEDVFQRECEFECVTPLMMRDDAVATHLYHIAQEAVHNAIKHGRASRISIVLISADDAAEMRVEDNGVGFSGQPGAGMGLHIMGYRAKMIGGTLEVRPRRAGGTAVSCCFPAAVTERIDA
jgi:PAS domain S-box-containing protein